MSLLDIITLVLLYSKVNNNIDISWVIVFLPAILRIIGSTIVKLKKW